MRVAFCIPGPSFSGWFLENWTALIKSLPPEIEWKLFRNYKLLDHKHASIVSGIYVMKTVYPYNDFACGTLDGGTLTRDNINEQTDLIEVKANGLGWMLVKAEVFDELDQPFTQDEHGTGEDALFQIRAKELGYRSYIDPTLIVGHEKMMILT